MRQLVTPRKRKSFTRNKIKSSNTALLGDSAAYIINSISLVIIMKTLIIDLTQNLESREGKKKVCERAQIFVYHNR